MSLSCLWGTKLKKWHYLTINTFKNNLCFNFPHKIKKKINISFIFSKDIFFKQTYVLIFAIKWKKNMSIIQSQNFKAKFRRTIFPAWKFHKFWIICDDFFSECYDGKYQLSTKYNFWTYVLSLRIMYGKIVIFVDITKWIKSYIIICKIFHLGWETSKENHNHQIQNHNHQIQNHYQYH